MLLVIFHLLGTRVLFWAQPSLRLIGPLDSSSGNDLNFKFTSAHPLKTHDREEILIKIVVVIVKMVTVLNLIL